MAKDFFNHQNLNYPSSHKCHSGCWRPRSSHTDEWNVNCVSHVQNDLIISIKLSIHYYVIWCSSLRNLPLGSPTATMVEQWKVVSPSGKKLCVAAWDCLMFISPNITTRYNYLTSCTVTLFAFSNTSFQCLLWR